MDTNTVDKVDQEWEFIENTIKTVALEVIGKNKQRSGRRGLRTWNEEIE